MTKKHTPSLEELREDLQSISEIIAVEPPEDDSVPVGAPECTMLAEQAYGRLLSDLELLSTCQSQLNDCRLISQDQARAYVGSLNVSLSDDCPIQMFTKTPSPIGVPEMQAAIESRAGELFQSFLTTAKELIAKFVAWIKRIWNTLFKSHADVSEKAEHLAETQAAVDAVAAANREAGIQPVDVVTTEFAAAVNKNLPTYEGLSPEAFEAAKAELQAIGQWNTVYTGLASVMLHQGSLLSNVRHLFQGLPAYFQATGHMIEAVHAALQHTGDRPKLIAALREIEDMKVGADVGFFAIPGTTMFQEASQFKSMSDFAQALDHYTLQEQSSHPSQGAMDVDVATKVILEHGSEFHVPVAAPEPHFLEEVEACEKALQAITSKEAYTQVFEQSGEDIVHEYDHALSQVVNLFYAASRILDVARRINNTQLNLVIAAQNVMMSRYKVAVLQGVASGNEDHLKKLNEIHQKMHASVRSWAR